MDAHMDAYMDAYMDLTHHTVVTSAKHAAVQASQSFDGRMPMDCSVGPTGTHSDHDS